VEVGVVERGIMSEASVTDAAVHKLEAAIPGVIILRR
jgi:hypothetical protein